MCYANWLIDWLIGYREKSNLSLANRRLERRVKEMMMQIEEEHHTMQDQKDQVCSTHPHSVILL